MRADDNASLFERKDASATFVILSGCSGGGKSTVLADRAAAAANQAWTFFDRGLVDAASALEDLTGEPVLRSLCMAHRYHRRVFVTSPWSEIYVTDADRKHDFDEAVAEYDRLAQAFPSLGYEVVPLPKKTPAARADFVLASLEIFNAPGR